jgi:hypothetical protein
VAESGKVTLTERAVAGLFCVQRSGNAPDSAKKPKIAEAFPIFSTPEQQAQYRKLQESVLPFTEEEVKRWQAWWDSPEGIAERKRLDEHMEQYKKPLTKEEWNKLLAPRLPKGWKSWDAQGREQRYQTPWHKDLAQYAFRGATLARAQAVPPVTLYLFV